MKALSHEQLCFFEGSEDIAVFLRLCTHVGSLTLS